MRMTVSADDGVAAVLVAIVLPVVFGMALLTIDAGSVWTTRRALVTATDAAALASARSAALGRRACPPDGDLVEANAPGSDVTGCTVVGTRSGGAVGVSAAQDAAVRFGPVLGVGDQRVASSSTATWGPLSYASGLRPIGVCVMDPHVQHLLGLGPDVGPHPKPGVNRLPYTKAQPDACGSNAAGNWGFVDFDGGSNANADLRRWFDAGYDGLVGIDDCDGDGNGSDPCAGDTGSSGGSIVAELDRLRASGEPFGIVIFDRVVGGGSNVRFRVFGFLGVRLVDFEVTGAEHKRYFDFTFERVVLDGICCDRSAIDTGVLGARLCAVDDTITTLRGCADDHGEG